jgi:hypothetical protein
MRATLLLQGPNICSVVDVGGHDGVVPTMSVGREEEDYINGKR